MMQYHRLLKIIILYFPYNVKKISTIENQSFFNSRLIISQFC